MNLCQTGIYLKFRKNITIFVLEGREEVPYFHAELIILQFLLDKNVKIFELNDLVSFLYYGYNLKVLNSSEKRERMMVGILKAIQHKYLMSFVSTP